MKQLHERMLNYTLKHTKLNEAVYSDVPEKAYQAIQRLELIYDDLRRMSRDGDPGTGAFKYYKEHFDIVLKYLYGFVDNYHHLLNNGKEKGLKENFSDSVHQQLKTIYQSASSAFNALNSIMSEIDLKELDAPGGYTGELLKEDIYHLDASSEAILRHYKKNAVHENLTEDTSAEFVPDTVNLNEPEQKIDVPSGEAIESTASQAIADMLIKSINDEWTTISEYNTLIANAESEGYNDIAQVVRDINAEENIHVGQLQAALETLSSQTSAIDAGKEEGEEQLS